MRSHPGILEGAKKACLLAIAFCIPWSGATQDNPTALRPTDCTFIGSPSHECGPQTFGTYLRSARTVAVVAMEATPSWASVVQRLDPNISLEHYNNLRDQYFHTFVAPRVSSDHDVSATYEEFKKLTEQGKVSSTGVLDRMSNQQENPENKNLQNKAEDLLRRWGRLTLVPDPELADLVLEVRRYKWFGFDTGEEQPVSFILVWAKHANPKRDDMIWLEKYQGSWKSSDTVAAVFRSFRGSAEQARKLASGHHKPGS